MSNNDFFDFGFTAVDEQELESVQKLSEVSNTAHTLEERLQKLHNAILPLLQQLKTNPEKDYIYWPNRVKKVEQFEKFIEQIAKGTD